MSRSTMTRCALVAACLLWGANSSLGQRIEFPSGVPGGGTPVTPAPTLPPGAVPPPATFDGTLAPPPAWDPYAEPTTGPQAQPYYAEPPPPSAYPAQQGALFPNGGPAPFSSGGYVFAGPNGTLAAYQRLLKKVEGQHEWLLGGGANGYGYQKVELRATVAFSLFPNQAPLEISPGFAAYWLQGPDTTGVPFGASYAELPPRLYDAYLDTVWQPTITPWLSADLGVRVGVFSDFDYFTSDSVRVKGRGYGIVTFTPTLKMAAGVIYYNRLGIKLLPAGGFIWTPNEDWRLDILFPNPRIAKRFATVGTTQLWCYGAGEYGGGVWTVRRVEPGVGSFGDIVDYSDLRVMLGVESRSLSGLQAFLEAGVVFDREFIFNTGIGNAFSPDTTMMLRSGISY